MKILKMLAILIVLAIATAIGVAYYTASKLDGYVKRSIENYATQSLGTKVTVGEVNLSLRQTQATIRDLEVANPPGFEGAHAFKAGTIEIVLNPKESKLDSENPLFPLANTIADINIDMVGRRDTLHPGTNNYIYVIGSDRLSSELHTINEEANAKYTKLELDYKYNDRKDPERIYYRSDHYNFAKKGIPAIFFFNGIHADYHLPSDSPDKIEYDALAKRAQLAFALAWELANRPERIKVDRDGK